VPPAATIGCARSSSLYTPEQNGIVERFFRSLEEECVWQRNLGDFVKPELPLPSGLTGVYALI
jgi:hypothetical protein